jgi:mono/diheme cytochrome c family protein
MCKYLLFFMLTGYSSAFAQTKQPSTTTTGKQLYAANCLTCHQQDGFGVPNLNPPLVKTSYVLGDKKKLIAWVLKGSGTEKVPIDGNYYNNNMPPQAGLQDVDIAKILTYVRSNFGNKASVVSESEVKAVRATVK